MLARREHTRQELMGKLLARNFTECLIDSTLQCLQDEGLQSDERAAEVYVRQRIAKGYGEMKIRAELRAKGVDSELIGHCLRCADVDWVDLARRVVDKKFFREIEQDRKMLLKQQRFLATRGFSNDTIRQVVRT